MNRLRLLKYSATIAASGLASTTFANSIIAAEIETENIENASTTVLLQKALRNFTNSFISALTSPGDDKIPIKPKKDDDSILIQSIPLKEKYQAPKYPIVLCHGLSGFDRLIIIPSVQQLTQLMTGKIDFSGSDSGYVYQEKGGVSLDYWYGIQEALEAKGTTVLVAKVPGFGTIQQRANQLNKFITGAVDRIREKSKEEVYNDDSEKSHLSFKDEGKKLKINLIAHSMGGLDCRWLISELEKKNYQVVSLTTITTPHRGSEVADFVVDLANKLPEQITLPQSIYQLTTDSLKKFNQTVIDDPKVLYFSYGAEFIPQWYNTFYGTWMIIHHLKGGPSDGMVSVNSAKWGTYLGTLSNLDHLDLINWTNAFKRVARDITPGLSKDDGINTINLYLEIADNLAKRGL